ncbi:hypothetical protein [Bartonella henselae]|uniref:Phage protein n=1 Tax=Bartonella henselae TaxID=38323 RepID=X5M5Z6_BARHN|nr:hypothetical protein [Bartonella henselae]OLL53558.1 hypothetical protein AT240_02745 [Bartonella henselae]OLL54654.1 hypothetical protein AT239_07290 [Bartonella henselae]UJM43808.1 hypothetical protein KAE73_03550 [Bartonella henselae]CDO47431.1 hypothetical protein BM1374165_01455 [Bartonella henselae]
MDQEHLTPAEQNQLKQGFLSGEQQGEDREIGIGEKAKNLEENFQGHQNVQQQQRSLQAGSQSQDLQKALEVDAPPDPQKDFMGYIQWLGKTLYKQGALLSEQPPAMSPESEQLHAFYQQSVAAVKQKHHDFDQAADFIYDTRAKQLAAFSSLYPEMADPNVVDAVIGNELKQILHDCAKKNQNPAEVIYAIAQKIGYTNAPNTIGENFQKRQNSARTLAAYNGLTPNGPISLDMLDKMSEAEFSHWVSDPKNKAAFNRLMGGGES